MEFKFYIIFSLSIFVLLLEIGCASDDTVEQPPLAETGSLWHRKFKLGEATRKFVPNGRRASRASLSADEQKLYELIMAYRSENGLPRIPISAALTKVAQVHSQDLNENNPNQGDCNMHSWSNKGSWTPCCYTPDHSQASCMWNKPREITDFQGNGYEISYGVFGNGATVTPEGALSGWKGSPGHNDVILNQSIWKDFPWKSIGVGIYKNYANVWFAAESSPGI